AIPGGKGGRGGNGAQVRFAMICGAGPAGLLWVQYLRNVLGFEGSLLVSEPSAAKRALAERFGAETIDPTGAELVDIVAARTCGRALQLIERGAVDAASLITHRYPSLDAVPGAFAADHAAPGYIKGVVTL